MLPLLRCCHRINGNSGSRSIQNGIRSRISHNCVRFTHLPRRLGEVTIRKKALATNILTPICMHNQINLDRWHLFIPYRKFHQTPRLNVHPLVWMFVKPVTKLTALLFGRRLRLHWKDLPHQQKAVILTALLGATALALTLYTMAHTETVPITGRKRFIFITHDQMIKIIETEVEEVLESCKDRILPSTHPLYKAVIEVAERLCVRNQDIQQMKDIQWKVFIIEQDDFNAHVYPTGEIFVNTGLVKLVTNSDQMAAILGHEMAHALLSHAAEQLSYAQKWDFFVIIVMAAIWMIIPSDGIASITSWFMNRVIKYFDLPYSRELEKEADKVGLQLAAKACFDVREASVVWSMMQVKDTVEGNSIPEFMSTHPSNETRVELIDFLIPRMTELRDKCNCPRLPSKDPRVAMQHVKRFVDDKVVAKQAGQNLSKVHLVHRNPTLQRRITPGQS